MKVKRTERGWAGHFICSDRCLFRRNTLLECGKLKVVISTVGGMRKDGGGLDTIGAFGRFYETMAFEAKKDGPYLEIDTGKEISFESEWSICADDYKKLPKDVDNKANEMHEGVVNEISKKMEKGAKSFRNPQENER